MTAADLTEEEVAVVQQFRRLKAMQARARVAAVTRAQEQAAYSTDPRWGEQLIERALQETA